MTTDKKFERSLGEMMKDREVVVAECEAGVYVGVLHSGLVRINDNYVRLIRYAEDAA